MLNRNNRKYFFNPVLGLVPFLSYLIVYYFTKNTIWGLTVCMVLSLISDFTVRAYTKSNVAGFGFWVTLTASILTLLTKAVFGSRIQTEDAYPIFFEIYMVFIVLTMRLFRQVLVGIVFKRKNHIERVFFNEFFDVAGIVQYFFILHIFLILIIKYIEGVSPFLEECLYTWVPILVILSLMLSMVLRIKTIAKRLQSERWLPIVNEKGDVLGRIAYSESRKKAVAHMHPIVRVAFIFEKKFIFGSEVLTTLIRLN